MKRTLLLLAAWLSLSACAYDDNDVWDKIGQIDKRLEEVEKQLRELNDQIEQLRALADAVSQAKFIVSYTQTENGYSLTFSDGQTIEILNGVSADDIPIIGIDSDGGVWYWTVTLQGTTDWLTDNEGNRLPVTGNDGEPGQPGQPGVTPIMGVDDDGYWTVDYGQGPVRITDPQGNPVTATGSGENSLFTSVTVEGNTMKFVLRNGTVISVPIILNVVIEFTNGINYTIPAGTSADIPFTVTGIGDELSASALAGGQWKAEVSVAKTAGNDWSGTLTVTAPQTPDTDKVVLLVSDDSGNVWMKQIDVVSGAAPTTDLTASGAANCFIVSSPGAYSFAALKADGSEPAGTVAVDWVWGAASDWNYPEYTGLPSIEYLIDPASISYAEGRIRFSTANIFHKGNVLLAATDASGKILWSWHIWLTDQPQSHEADGEQTVFMDRNLGAASAQHGSSENLGLLYQWGRKEPFISANAITASEETSGAFAAATAANVLNRTAFGDISWGAVTPASRLTYDQAAAQPTSLVNNANYSPAYGVTDWSAESNPCPAGWTVPSQLQMWGHFGFTGYSQSHPCTFDDQNKGWVPDGYQSEWWPASGERDAGLGGRIREVGSYGYFWTGTQGSSNNMAPYVRMNQSEARSLQASKSWAYAVRCVRR